MKRFLILIFLSNQFNAWAQSPSATTLMQTLNSVLGDSTLSHADYFNQYDSLIHLIYPNDSSEAGPVGAFEKWKEFYSNRIGANSKPTNMERDYLNALKAAKSRNATNCSGFIGGNWENIGPKNFIQTYQNQGVINDIWVDPNDDQFIYAASEGGGLWKFDNGLWSNITDNNSANLGTTGINVIAVNPANRDDIYISTKLYRHFNNNGYGWDDGTQLGGYGLGIYHTTNGGATWILESSGLPINAAELSAFDIKFSPTKVNSKDFVVLTLRDEWGGADKVYTKFDNNSWVLVDPLGLTPAFHPCVFATSKINTLVDIEFDSQFPGQYFISSGAQNWGHCNGLWRFTFNLSTGAPLSHEEIIDSRFNGQPITTFYNPSTLTYSPNPVVHNDVTMASNRMEFGANGLIRVYSIYMSDNSCSWHVAPYQDEVIITEWHVNSTGPATFIQTLVNIPC